MKKRDIIILVALAVVVIMVAWYFLVIGPKRDEIADLDQKLQTEKSKFEADAQRVDRIDEERTAARQTSGELLKLNKLIPADSQVPSLMVELQQSANEAGVKFMRVEPAEPFAAPDGNTIVPFEMEFQGNFFDVNDFLFRVENYARLEGNDVNVTGRLVSVVNIEIGEPSLEAKFPEILVTLGMNAYMTGPVQTAATRSAAASGSSGAAASGESETPAGP